jgi:cell wall hydrolase
LPSNATYQDPPQLNWGLRKWMAAAGVTLSLGAVVIFANLQAQSERQETMLLEQTAELDRLVADYQFFVENETQGNKTRGKIPTPVLSSRKTALSAPANLRAGLAGGGAPANTLRAGLAGGGAPANTLRAGLAGGGAPANMADLIKFDLTTLKIAEITADEKRCLAEAIYYESRNEPIIGQMAVADVVLNRVASPIYPDSICGVVYQGAERVTGCQFSFTCDGSLDKRRNAIVWDKSDELASAVLAGVRVPVSRNATHYHADYVSPYWAPNLTPTAQIGTHQFYRFPDRRVSSAAQ